MAPFDAAQQVVTFLRSLVDAEVQALLRQHDVANGCLEVLCIDLAFLVAVELIEHPLECFFVEIYAPVLEHVPQFGRNDLELAFFEVEIIETGIRRAPLIMELIKNFLHQFCKFHLRVYLLLLKDYLFFLEMLFKLWVRPGVMPEIKLLWLMDGCPDPVREFITIHVWVLNFFEFFLGITFLKSGRQPFFLPHQFSQVI